MTAPLSNPTEGERALTDFHVMMSNSAVALTQRTSQLQNLFGSSMARCSNSVSGSMPVLMALARLDPDTLQELFDLQSAIADRFREQNDQWVQGLNRIAGEASQLKKTNTVSKFMEQQCNLVGQWVALWLSQSTNLATQMENIQVDVAYWIAQKGSAAG